MVKTSHVGMVIQNVPIQNIPASLAKTSFWAILLGAGPRVVGGVSKPPRDKCPGENCPSLAGNDSRFMPLNSSDGSTLQ